MTSRPAAEVEIGEPLVRQLLADQHPDLAGLPLRRAGSHGWDNEVFRLGEDLAVRLPRREAAVPSVAVELRWLPALALRLPLPTPVPLRSGLPGAGYPWPWSIVRWLPGEPVGTTALRPGSAQVLADFLVALQRTAPADAPRNPVRGVPLAQREAALDAALEHLPDAVAVAEAWDRVTADAPAYEGPPVWLHGDFHAANLLHSEGRLTGVIDFGDLSAGDPACDYAVAWMLFDREHREPLRRAADRHGPGTWRRAHAWAILLGAIIVAHSDDVPLLAAVGRRTLVAALESADTTPTQDYPL